MKDHHKDKAHSEHKHAHHHAHHHKHPHHEGHAHHHEHHSHKVHPHHKGAGMPYFENDHWQKPVQDVMVADGRYSSEMNQAAEYKHDVDSLASYLKKHKMQY